MQHAAAVVVSAYFAPPPPALRHRRCHSYRQELRPLLPLVPHPLYDLPRPGALRSAGKRHVRGPGGAVHGATGPPPKMSELAPSPISCHPRGGRCSSSFHTLLVAYQRDARPEQCGGGTCVALMGRCATTAVPLQ